MDGLFIQHLIDPDGRFYYIAWVACVIISIVLHELGHGIAALKLGDSTPRDQGRMTLSPLVHMGPFSIVVLLITGIAWGAMPINPSRLKGKYGEANVAASGPGVNVVLALLGLAGAIAWMRVTGDLPKDGTPAKNAFDILWLFASLNVILVIFNLLPAPPLDGSHILANLHRGYANLLASPGFQSVALLPFIAAFILVSLLIDPVKFGTLHIISELGGVPLMLTEGY